jgi:hypothetical protein
MDVTLLRTLLHYDPETGRFTWRASQGRAKAGTRAGTLNSTGYRYIKVEGKSHKEHRLAWLYAHSVWPTEFIDHINGIKDDNRLSNLREATNAQNLANQGKQRTNTSGHKGVSWDKQRKKWSAKIQINRRTIHLGVFENKEDAAEAYKTAALKYHGEFARQ